MSCSAAPCPCCGEQVQLPGLCFCVSCTESLVRPDGLDWRTDTPRVFYRAGDREAFEAKRDNYPPPPPTVDTFPWLAN